MNLSSWRYAQPQAKLIRNATTGNSRETMFVISSYGPWLSQERRLPHSGLIDWQVRNRS